MYRMVLSMNRLLILSLLSLGGLCLQGQTASSITISTNPPGPQFQVDGATYHSAQTFIWPTGSSHYVVFVTDAALPGETTNLVQTSQNGTIQYLFGGWEDNNGLVQPTGVPVQRVTANPDITTFTANLSVAYRVQLSYVTPASPNAVSPPVCGAPGAIPVGQSSPGVVYIGGQCYWSSATIFVAANSPAILNAYPYPGYAFTGWSINGANPTPFLTTLTITAPITIAPIFVPAKRVSFLTSPLGLNVLVDHTPIPTRNVADVPNCPNNETLPAVVQLGFPPLCFGDFDFAPGSTHFISGITPQRDNSGNLWVFNAWSNGQGQDAIYKVDNNPNSPVSLTADYIPGVAVAFLTSPSGLKLTVDGLSNYTSYDFYWGVGTTHTVTAAATQTGSNGRVYSFQRWSNQAGPTETVTVDSSMTGSGYRQTANYSELSRVVVQSSPSGLTLQVDGSNCVTPCNVDRASGATFTVSAPTQIAMGKAARLDFGSWSDGGASNHTITVSQNFAVATASYTTLYQLSATSNPGNGSAFKVSPSSSDMFYSQGAQVTVTAMPNNGFKFGHWTGALAGSYPTGTVTMTAPESVVANMGTVPYIVPAGIQNAVGTTPSTAMAPGSIISIYGESLASGVQVGPANPLAQTINGTTVTINSTILPLLFVSPQQINAQLPSSLGDGNYTLEVQNTGLPEVSGTLTVARNAPGLFFNTVGSTAYAMAFHADSSMISSTSPASAGETISFLGTGFGPYKTPVFDGFFPPNPPPAVDDSVVLSVGGVNPSSTSTAAPGFTGVVTTQFQVPTGLPSGTSVPVFVSINGVESNTVMLPIQ
jgi:uncharacterized protein (TIGR03437 family)